MKDVRTLEGLTALVTGGIRNNGLAIARALGREGARVALFFRDDWPTARSAAAALAGEGIGTHLTAVELSDVEAVRAAHLRVAGEFGAIDVLVNCAAIRPRSKIMDVTVEEWDSVHAINVRAPFFLSPGRPAGHGA